MLTPKMIRVLHFADTINRFDFIDSVLTELDRDRFDISLLTVSPSKNRTGAYSDSQKYPAKCLDQSMSIWDLRIWWALASEIRRFRPHILHAHHYTEAIMGGILAKLMGVPVFVIGHHYADLIYLLTAGFKRRMVLWGEKLANSLADRVVVPTQAVVDLLVRQGEPVHKIIPIPYGTDFRMFKDAETEPSSELRGLDEEDVPVAFACGRLNPEKGFEYLIMAIPAILQKLPRFRLVIAGTGPEESRLKEIVRSLGIERTVLFFGWRNDTLHLIREADIVIQPSLSESFCQVAVEALAVGTPVVMTPVGIGPEILVNGERGGYLVPPRDSMSIAEAVTTVLADRSKSSMLAREGRAYILENLSAEKTTKRYQRLYEELFEGLPKE